MLARIAAFVAAFAGAAWAASSVLTRWRRPRDDGGGKDAPATGVHIAGSSVNLPDMSAALAVKVPVSEAQQADPAALAAVYDSMAATFGSGGLNVAAVAATGQYFAGVEGPGDAPPEPLAYADFPTPLPNAAVRLCVVFFRRANPQLAELVHAAAKEVVAALPEGTRAHLNDPGHYHVTVFMSSQPHTLRPDPFDPAALPPTGDLPPSQLAAALQPSAATLEREIDVMRAAAAATPPPSLVVHRLLLADSGTLLLCSVDVSRQLTGLRARLRVALPGAPPRQSTIFHASVARVLTPRQLDAAAVARVQAVCQRWTERLRGVRFEPGCLHHVREQRFTTVEGPCVALPFRGRSAEGPDGSAASVPERV